MKIFRKIDELRKQNIIHGDLHLDNVLVEKTEINLIDFETARVETNEMSIDDYKNVLSFVLSTTIEGKSCSLRDYSLYTDRFCTLGLDIQDAAELCEKCRALELSEQIHGVNDFITYIEELHQKYGNRQF